MAERMIVMYAGRKAEEGPFDQVIDSPCHPSTKDLISCVPHLLDTLTDERPELTEIGGIVPSLREFGKNQCLFASRCAVADDTCLANRGRRKTNLITRRGQPAGMRKMCDGRVQTQQRRSAA